MRKKFISMVVILCMGILLFCGCGRPDVQSLPVVESSEQEVAETKTQAESEEQMDMIENEETFSSETNDGSLFMIDYGNLPVEQWAAKVSELNVDENTLLVGTDVAYRDEVVSRLNEYLEENGYTVQVVFLKLPEDAMLDGKIVEFSQYLQAHGVALDLIPVWKRDLSGMAENDLLVDISDYLSTEQGMEIKNAVSDLFWEETEVEQNWYGVGTTYASFSGWEADADLMEAYDLSEEDLAKPLDELEEIFRAVKEGGSVPFSYVPAFLFEALPVTLADGSLPIGYWNDAQDTETVCNLFETEEMYRLLEMMNTYYEEGLVSVVDGITEFKDSLLTPANNTFPVHRTDGLDTWMDDNGKRYVRIPYYENNQSSMVTKVNAIPSWSEKSAESLDFLHFIYTDEEVSSLLLYGIEGVDYAVDADGGYTAGEALTEATLYERSLGNRDLCAPLSPYEDETKIALENNAEQSLRRDFLDGFCFDDSKVQEETEAVQAIFCNLGTMRSLFAFQGYPVDGVNDWEEYYQIICQELEDVGIERIVEEMNRQIQN